MKNICVAFVLFNKKAKQMLNTLMRKYFFLVSQERFIVYDNTYILLLMSVLDDKAFHNIH